LTAVPDANQQIHLNLDGAWGTTPWIETLDLREWGPRLRYHGKRKEVDAFYQQISGRLKPFVLYGSGDFHYLAGVLLRGIAEPVTVVSFDNHPDWDIRPPHWACGGWVNRALELPHIDRVSVWGCGNFELRFPSILFANRRALRSGQLEVHAWAERQPIAVQRRFGCMTRQNWRGRFEQFAQSLRGRGVYVTIDLDCLNDQEAATNWEQGLFAAGDVAWALSQIRQLARIVAGDLCGAVSEPRYARRFQRFAGNWDHPNLAVANRQKAGDINRVSLETIWPALCE
jgi:hypothetical protein